MSKNIVAVFLCDRKYYSKFMKTCEQLINNGKYKGDIVLVVGDDLKSASSEQFILKFNIKVKYFPNIVFSEDFIKIQKSLPRPGHWFEKLFQYHKLYLFDVYFKQWDYVFYIDCGMSIYNSVQPIINLSSPGIMWANRDGVDGEVFEEDEIRSYNKLIGDGIGQSLKLHAQFCKVEPYYTSLKEKYELGHNCFQTTTMLYSTDLISNDTFSNLLSLTNQYPISRTNDQGIISLYFTKIISSWKQIPHLLNNQYTYDLVNCVHKPYIMIKYPSTHFINKGYFATYTGQINETKQN